MTALGVEIGGIDACRRHAPPVLHAAKFPCYWHISGAFQRRSDDPKYLWVESGADLYLNLIDADQPKYFPVPIFERAMDWLDLHASERPLVHCEQGRSRSASIVLLWLAKRAREIPAGSFSESADAFRALYPAYEPGVGISEFLAGSWNLLR